MKRSPLSLIAAAAVFGCAPVAALAQDESGLDIQVADPAALDEGGLVVPGGDVELELAVPEAPEAPPVDAAPPEVAPLSDAAADAARAGNPALKELSNEEIQELIRLINEASQYIQGIRLQEGLANLMEAEELVPDLFQIHNLRGAAYTKMRDFEKARASFEHAIELAPNVFHAQFNLAEVEYVTGNYEHAEAEFKRLLQENPELDFGTKRLLEYKIIICRLKQGDEAGANELLSKFNYLDDTPIYYFGNAAVALSNEKEEEAQEWLQSARKIYEPEQIQVFMDALVEAGWIDSL